MRFVPRGTMKAGKGRERSREVEKEGRCGEQIACLIAKLTNAAKIFNSSPPALNGPHNRITYPDPYPLGLELSFRAFWGFRAAECDGHCYAVGPISLRHKAPVHGPW